jgi:hypothetical protein
MNEFHIDDCLINSDHFFINSWNFPQQIDYTTNQSQFVELSNVHHDIPSSNEINSTSFTPSTIIYDLQIPQNSSLRLDKKKKLFLKISVHLDFGLCRM